MERVLAYTDESGAFGWAINKGSSSHFVIAAILVKESEKLELEKNLEVIRNNFFKQGEMKSSKIGKDSKKRRALLGELRFLPFSIFAVVFDKRKMVEYKGLRYKTSFYKFLNNIVHEELRRAFVRLVILADEIGGSEYMQSFSRYVKSESDAPNLFGDAKFTFLRSDSSSLCIQLADIIAGSIARKYDELYFKENDRDFVPIIKNKLTRIQLYPLNYETYTLENSPIAVGYDEEIANICLKQVIEYIQMYKRSEDIERQCQILSLKYLLFRFMHNDLHKYISTKELKKQLETTKMAGISTQSFRNKIIAKMRDEGVILASSSRGYKIPSTIQELCDFINHGTTIIAPMLSRLKKCYDLIRLGTNNELDLFDSIEDENLKKLLKEYKSI